MDRRSFLTSLIGGLAAASLGTVAIAAPQPQPAAEPLRPEDAPQVDAEAFDKSDADYAHYYYRRRRRRRWRRGYWHRHYYRRRWRRHHHHHYYYRRRYYRRRYYW